MQTTPATREQVLEWKRLYEKYRETLRPNRRSGTELDAYFRLSYPYQPLEHPKFMKVMRENIMYEQDLLDDRNPQIVIYETDGVLVGIDLVTGFFQVECEDIDRAVPIWDDLFVYRGLDESDLQNYYLTAEYVRLCGMDK